jgi:hypothetical protein
MDIILAHLIEFNLVMILEVAGKPWMQKRTINSVIFLMILYNVSITKHVNVIGTGIPSPCNQAWNRIFYIFWKTLTKLNTVLYGPNEVFDSISLSGGF